MAISSKKRPRQRKVTMKTLADHGNRALKPESEEKVYEFGNGTVGKKQKTPYYQ